MKKLTELRIGERAIIQSIESTNISSTLLEMGFTPGSEVKIKMKAPFGDPIAVNVMRSTIAIRLQDAELIAVKSIDNK